MAGETQRRLAAIVLADVVGYSRLMGADEAVTLDAMRGHRHELWDPTIERYGGRVVNRAGDSALIEFASAVAAMECSVAIQSAMAQRNADVPEDECIQLRIGVNVGEVVVDGEEIYGDGVNIAARLQTLAEPAGIALSGNVYENIANRLDLPLVDAGEHTVKNISRPIRVWRWSTDRAPANAQPENGPGQLALPDIPSVAVLPFDNLSGDREQEYFADGMTEDIITGLSQFDSLFVIARNSTFTYKGRPVNISEVATTFGVRYVLEGSVRRAGNKIRVNVQLIDATTTSHVWAQRFDRDLDDIFAVQDEITETIIGAIAPEIDDAERRLAQRKAPDSLDTWSRYQRGLAAYYMTTREGLESAIRQFDEINALDPRYAPAFGSAANARFRYLTQFSWSNDAILAEAQEKAQTGAALDPKNSECLMALSRAYSFGGRHDVAIEKAKEALALTPNAAIANFVLGFVFARAGLCEEAIIQLDTAIRLSPRDAYIAGFRAVRMIMLFQLERYDEAYETGRLAYSAPNRRPGSFLFAAATLMKLGRRDEATSLLTELRQSDPDVSLRKTREQIAWSFPRSGKMVNTLIEALRDAGLPE